MKEIFEALTQKYKGSPAEQITGLGKFFSYFVAENASLPYVVSYMMPSPISRPMSSSRKIEAHVIIMAVTDFKLGQGQLNDLKDAILDTYDGARLTIPGYTLVNIEPVELHQVLDDTDPDELLWNYPVKFKINIE